MHYVGTRYAFHDASNQCQNSPDGRVSRGCGFPPTLFCHIPGAPDSEELTLRDIEEGNINKHGVGSIKLRGCCGLAQKDGLGYAWVDTCCIDKTNLVELSEAHQLHVSMVHVCFVVLRLHV